MQRFIFLQTVVDNDGKKRMCGGKVFGCKKLATECCGWNKTYKECKEFISGKLDKYIDKEKSIEEQAENNRKEIQAERKRKQRAELREKNKKNKVRESEQINDNGLMSAVIKKETIDCDLVTDTTITNNLHSEKTMNQKLKFEEVIKELFYHSREYSCF